MGRGILSRVLDPAVGRLLAPREHATERDEQERHAALEAAGYATVWDSSRVPGMQQLGAVLARVRADGARWPMQRAAVKGYAYMAHETDSTLFEALTTAMNSGQRARTGPELEAAISALQSLVKTRRELTDDDLMALETVARLGETKSVIAYLSAL